jgi:hypothetical protein
LYEGKVTPGAVASIQQVRVTVKGRTLDRAAIERQLTLTVHPATTGRIGVISNPETLVLGVDAATTVSFQIPPGPDAPAVGDLIVRATSGDLSELVDLGGGRYSARFLAPRVNYPHLSLITVADRRAPDRVFGVGVIPLMGKVDFPVQTTPDAAVVLRLGDREYGPVKAAADGRAMVPIIVPPGMAQATMISVVGGQRTETPIELGVPEARRLAVMPLLKGVPSDEAAVVPVRVLVRLPDGAPDPAAALNLSVTAGRIGRPVHLGDGLYEAPFTPPPGRVQTVATVQATVPGGTVQSDAVELTLLPALPGSVELSADPTTLAAGGTGLKAFVKVKGADGVGLADRTVVITATGATAKGPVQDLKGGDYRLDLTAGGVTDVVLTALAPPAASGNGLSHVLVLPSSERLPADGVTSAPVLIVTTDAWGYPVGGVPVTLSLGGSPGALPSTVTTDVRGVAEAYYTAGGAPGLARITASAGGHVGAAGVVLSGLSALPDLPVGGTADDRRVVAAWERLRAAVAVAREGGTGQPVAVEPTAPAGGILAALAVDVQPATVAPGGSVTLRVRATDAGGRGVGGAKLDLLASGGARFGGLTELGDGQYEATLTVPADATDKIRVSVIDPAGATSAILELPVSGAPVAASSSPWATGSTEAPPQPVATIVPETEAPTPRPQKDEVERPHLRIKLAGLASSYQYRQEPSSNPGELLSAPLAWGGDVGGAAVPLGIETTVRATIPRVPYLGFHGSFRWSRYQVDSSTFSNPAVDNLIGVQLAIVPRLPIAIGRDELSLGARVGFRYDDFITFRGCTDPGCEVRYEPLGVPGLGVGLEVGAEIWHLYAVVAGQAGFAYGSQPYAANVDANLGWNVTKNVFLDAGFGWQLRKSELEGRESGNLRGTLSDQQLLGTFGVGFSL